MGGPSVPLDFCQLAQSRLNRASDHGRVTPHTLKLVYLTIIHLAKQTWLLPQTIADAVKQRRHQVVLNEREAERLDRIRNPSKYRGK